MQAYIIRLSINKDLKLEKRKGGRQVAPIKVLYNSLVTEGLPKPYVYYNVYHNYN